MKNYALLLTMSTFLSIHSSDANAGWVEFETFFESTWTLPPNTECGSFENAYACAHHGSNAWAIAINDIGEARSMATFANLFEYNVEDADYSPGMNDHAWLDDGDVGILWTHGGSGWAPNWQYSALMSHTVNGAYSCNSIQSQMVYGDEGGSDGGDLEVLILPGCNGLHYCLSWDWNHTEDLHTVNAFHALSWHSDATAKDRMEDLAYEAYDNSVSSAWMSIMRYEAPGGRWNCPVSVAKADTIANAQAYLYNETLNLEYGDKTPNRAVRRKFSRCDPGNPGPAHGDTFENTNCSAKNISEIMGNTLCHSKSDIFSAIQQAVEASEERLNSPEQASGTKMLSLADFAEIVNFSRHGKTKSIHKIISDDGRREKWTQLSNVSKFTEEQLRDRWAKKEILNDDDGMCDEDAIFHKEVVMQDNFRQRLVYINTHGNHRGTLPGDSQLTSRAYSLIRETGLPEHEISDFQIDHIEEDTRNEETGDVSEARHVATMIQFSRKVNGYPVRNSTIDVTFGPENQLQRVAVEWPQVLVPEGLTWLGWEAIEKKIEDIAEDIDTFGIEYIPYDNADNRQFVPALVVIKRSTLSKEKSDAMIIPGEIISIPLVGDASETDDGGELEDVDSDEQADTLEQTKSANFLAGNCALLPVGRGSTLLSILSRLLYAVRR